MRQTEVIIGDLRIHSKRKGVEDGTYCVLRNDIDDIDNEMDTRSNVGLVIILHGSHKQNDKPEVQSPYMSV